MNEKISEQKSVKKTANPLKSKTFRDFSFICGVWVICIIIARALNLEQLFMFLITGLSSLAPIILLVIFVYHNIENRKKKK